MKRYRISGRYDCTEFDTGEWVEVEEALAEKDRADKLQSIIHASSASNYAAAERKAARKAVKAERERRIGCVQFKAKAWAEFALTLHPASESRPQVERVVDEFCSVIDAIREARP